MGDATVCQLCLELPEMQGPLPGACREGGAQGWSPGSPQLLLAPPIPAGRNRLGTHMTAFQCISSCSPALWKVLFGHIFLSGGTGTCSGLRFRLQREISALVSPKINVKVQSPPPTPWGFESSF